MQTKLTLRLDDALIKEAKAISEAEGKSLSRLVGDYFEQLTQRRSESISQLNPITRSLKGVLKRADVSELDYKNYLEEKYL